MADNNNNDNNSKAMVIGIAGALIGAAATASAMVLSDEKNRKKLEKVIGDLREHGDKLLEVVQREAGEFKKMARGTAEEIKKTSPSKKSSSKKVASKKKAA